MKFTLTISEEVMNTIITALRFERQRAKAENNEHDLKYINNAIEEIDQNTYVASVMEHKKGN